MNEMSRDAYRRKVETAVDAMEARESAQRDRDDALALLAKIVNRAGRARRTSAEACPVADVPVALLVEAQQLLELLPEEPFATSEIRHASNRVFD